MLSAGAAMEPFRRILTYAFRAGASGYLAGRAIWWPAALEYPDWDAFRRRVREHGLPYVALVQSLLDPARNAPGCRSRRMQGWHHAGGWRTWLPEQAYQG